MTHAALDRVRFVLVGPQFGGNTGSVARALKNLGFERLVLVRPCFPPDDAEARKMAVDARDLLDRAERHESLADALAGAVTVVGTTGRRGKQRQPHYRLDRFGGELRELAGRGEIAVMFGCEESGLDDRALDRCTHLVELPASQAYPSFNLAQAVLLLAWELRRDTWPEPPPDGPPPAPHDEREPMFDQLEEALVQIGFVHEPTVEPIMRRMRRLIGRALPTSLEVRMLRGLARQIQWVAGQAGVVRGRAPDPADPADPDVER